MRYNDVLGPRTITDAKLQNIIGLIDDVRGKLVVTKGATSAHENSAVKIIVPGIGDFNESVFMHGDCWRLGCILKRVYPEAKCHQVWHTIAAGHIITEIDGVCFDIRGEIKLKDLEEYEFDTLDISEEELRRYASRTFERFYKEYQTWDGITPREQMEAFFAFDATGLNKEQIIQKLNDSYHWGYESTKRYYELFLSLNNDTKKK